MSGVLLRCPSCGTTRASPGECEACHESAVRYFCSNHAPGLWLDGPACTRCGARFGERAPEAPRPAPAPPERPRVRAPAPAAGSPRGPTGSAGAPYPRDPRPRRPEAPPRMPDWREEFLRRHRAARAPAEPAAGPGRAVPGVKAAGCLLRLMLILVFLFLASTFGMVLFTGSLFRMF